jgi:hypothetical protein
MIENRKILPGVSKYNIIYCYCSNEYIKDTLGEACYTYTWINLVGFGVHGELILRYIIDDWGVKFEMDLCGLERETLGVTNVSFPKNNDLAWLININYSRSFQFVSCV